MMKLGTLAGAMRQDFVHARVDSRLGHHRFAVTRPVGREQRRMVPCGVGYGLQGGLYAASEAGVHGTAHEL